MTSGVARTAAATAARQRGAAQRAASRMGIDQVEHLDDEHLAALAGTLVTECLRRGLAVPDLRA